ncbi:MAG: hypothetical protein H0V82_04900 [Candidatus Protochlamydia sp.]|nr:hypothetical protein [Candidatus Protochlamydia sp.]
MLRDSKVQLLNGKWMTQEELFLKYKSINNNTYITPNPQLPEEAIKKILENLKPDNLANTHIVSKKWNEWSEKALINWFNKNAQKPISLKLSNNFLLEFVKKNGQDLEILNLDWEKYRRPEIDGDYLKELIKYCPNLRQLFMRSHKITDAGLAHISRLTTLQSLGLRYCKQITDAGLINFSSLTSLETLDLTGNEQIIGTGFAHLSNLTALNLYSGKRINLLNNKEKLLKQVKIPINMYILDIRYFDEL